MERDERQIEFPFFKAYDEPQKMEAAFKVRTFDCTKDRHQTLPSGVCMLCKQQIQFGAGAEK